MSSDEVIDDIEIVVNTETIGEVYYLCGTCGARVEYLEPECGECKTKQVWFSG